MNRIICEHQLYSNLPILDVSEQDYGSPTHRSHRPISRTSRSSSRPRPRSEEIPMEDMHGSASSTRPSSPHINKLCPI